MGRFRSSIGSEFKKIILKLLDAKFSYAKIADIIGVSKSCVLGFVKRYHQRKSVDNREMVSLVENAFRTGRPRKTTDRIDRLIVQHALKNRRTPSDSCF